MQKASWGLIFTAGLGFLIWANSGWRYASADRPLPPAPRGSGDQLIALSFEGEGATPQVVIIDSQTRAMSVYHIDRTTGEVSLKSVRNVRWDLMMEEFNGVTPTPQEIRALLERR